MIRFYFSRLHWYITFNTFRCRIDTIMTKEMPTIYEPYGRYWFEPTVYKKIMIIIFYLHMHLHTHSEGEEGKEEKKERREREREREFNKQNVSRISTDWQQTFDQKISTDWYQLRSILFLFCQQNLLLLWIDLYS